MTANQINYMKNVETERSNRASEQLQRQKMWNDWMIANLQAQTSRERMATDTAINQSQIESKEFVSALDRQQQRTLYEDKRDKVEIPNIAINVTDAETRKQQLEVNKQKLVFDFVGNLINLAGHSGFMSLYATR